MSDIALDDFVQRALTIGILEMEELQAIWQVLGTQNVTLEEFQQTALRRGSLTKYQLERLKYGETSGFFFGDYKVLYLVGSGTFARVYRAVHRKTGQVAAVKVLRARFSQDPQAVDLFVREARFSMGLKHPNIVTVHEVTSIKGEHFMAMDFIEGQTLREMIKTQKVIPPILATRIAVDICSALNFAFQKGHSHRDLKLSNVLISSSGKAVLIDFGLAATEKEEEQNAKMQRTIDYAALEKVTGAPRNDKRSDIYFTGVIYYYMLCGSSPILETKERNRRMERGRFLNATPIREKNSQTPPILALIVDRAMSLDVERRYQNPGGMLRDLEIALVKLEEGRTDESALLETTTQRVVKNSSEKPTILVLESDQELQNVFRDALRKEDFRVLIIADPQRAMERFDTPDHGIDCVLFNAQSLGAGAVLSFNQLGTLPAGERIPAVLLLAENQVNWGAKAKRNKIRLAVGMPIPIKRLADIIHRLIDTRDSQET